MVVDLFKIITTTFKEQKTGPEILEWITGAGQKAFAEKFLVPLGEAYQAHLQREQKREKPEPLRMKANLNADPSLPFDGAKFEGNKGEKHLPQGEEDMEECSGHNDL